MTWNDLTPDAIAGIRELIFRSAVVASNAAILQNVDPTETQLRAFYKSHYRYLAGALLVTFLGVILIFPLFFG